MMKRPRRRGQSLVEFALIAPIFFFVMFGIIEGGRLLWNYHTVNNAAKEGSRYAMVRGANTELPSGPATDANVTAYVESKATGLNEDALDVDLQTPNGMDNKAEFTVQVDYEFEFIVAQLLGVDETLTLSASSTAIFSR